MPSSLLRTCIPLPTLTTVLLVPCRTWAVLRAIPWLMDLVVPAFRVLAVLSILDMVPVRVPWVPFHPIMLMAVLNPPCRWVQAVPLRVDQARAAMLAYTVAQLAP